MGREVTGHWFEELTVKLGGDGVVAMATCSCGWLSDAEGPSSHNWRAAIQRWAEHYAESAR